jgi:hypothetical protein
MRTVVGVLEEPYSAKPAQLSSQRLHRMDTVPAYVDWRVCAATPLSEITWLYVYGSSKTPATVLQGEEREEEGRGRELECLDLSEEEIKRLEEKKDSGYGGSQGLIRLAPKVVFD